MNKKWKAMMTLCAFMVLYELYWKWHIKRRGLPPGPSRLMRCYALIKMFLFSKRPIDEMEFARWCQKNYGSDGIIYQSVFGKGLIFIFSSKMAKQVLNNKNALDRPIFSTHSELHIESTADGTMPFANLNGKQWEKRRKLSQTILFRMCTTEYVGKILDEAINNVVIKELNKICDNKTETLWYPSALMKYLAFNTVYYSNCGKHISINDPIYEPMVAAITETFGWLQIGIILSILPKWILFSLKLIPNSSYNKIIKFIKVRHVLSEKFAESFKKDNDFTDNKKDAKYYVDYIQNTLTKSEMLADAQALFGAGTDTTSSGLNFAIIFSAKYQNIQNKVRNELINCYNKNIDNAATDGIRRFNMNWIHQLTYFRAFIYEVLRVSSITKAGLPHSAAKDIIINISDNKQYIIPKGFIIGYNIELMQKYTENRENWIDSSDKMCLENWINPDTNKFEINPSFITFGLGRRDCVGRTLAIKEMYIIMGYLLLNYKFSSKNEIKIKTKWNGVNVIDPPIGVIVERLYKK